MAIQSGAAGNGQPYITMQNGHSQTPYTIPVSNTN